MIRTFVSARSELAREGLAAIVRGDARLALAGEGRLEDLERAFVAIDPDVLLEAREETLAMPRAFDVPTVALVDDPREAWVQNVESEERGGFALLGNDASPAQVVAAIVAVAAGLVAVQPRALARYGDAANVEVREPVAAIATRVEKLTPRERDVLAQLARGVANKTIASDLGISEHTVKFHVASIFAKLGAASRTEAVAQGVRHGLIML